MAATTSSPTVEHLLAVAETLLLEHGYEHVSVRAINAAAGMNPAAVHYHFGSKAALVGELLERRLGPLWQDRLAELATRRRNGWTPTVGELVDVALDPLAELAADPVGRLRLRLLATVVLARVDVQWHSQWFSLAPWARLLRTACPKLNQREAERRWALAFELVLRAFGQPAGEPPRRGRAAFRTVHTFVTAGLAAEEEMP
ncbi:TetR/AcrR family transcriptional regulator [Sciscionella sediminilitoris]|uniref:TetR/AcrR family transcriptional regulator n=1 Tax=Sciscionella sediminilitoris TaxID=1445613 RepID=UPI0004DFB104|nr:TetR/AcrR family transcriptional regulator [Sciscionella sp. SE31]